MATETVNNEKPMEILCDECGAMMTRRDQRASQTMYRCDACGYVMFWLDWPARSGEREAARDG